jgi:hypothetical protein
MQRLAEATGKSVKWWLSGEEAKYEGTVPAPGQSVSENVHPHRAGSAPTAIAGGSAKVDPRALQLVIQAVNEWEDENNLDIAPERRSAVIAFLYDYLQKSGDDGERALNEALRAIR